MTTRKEMLLQKIREFNKFMKTLNMVANVGPFDYLYHLRKTAMENIKRQNITDQELLDQAYTNGILLLEVLEKYIPNECLLIRPFGLNVDDLTSLEEYAVLVDAFRDKCKHLTCQELTLKIGKDVQTQLDTTKKLITKYLLILGELGYALGKASAQNNQADFTDMIKDLIKKVLSYGCALQKLASFYLNNQDIQETA